MTEWEADRRGIYGKIDFIYRRNGKQVVFFITFANWEFGWFEQGTVQDSKLLILILQDYD